MRISDWSSDVFSSDLNAVFSAGALTVSSAGGPLGRVVVATHPEARTLAPSRPGTAKRQLKRLNSRMGRLPSLWNHHFCRVQPASLQTMRTTRDPYYERCVLYTL